MRMNSSRLNLHFSLVALLTLVSLQSMAANKPVRSPLCPAVTPQTENLVTDSDKSQSEIEHELLSQRGTGNTSLDWVEDPDANNSCGGYYLAPGATATEKKSASSGSNDFSALSFSTPNAQNTPTHMSADNIAHSNTGDTVLTDNVLFQQGDTRFYCDTLNYNTNTSKSTLQGNVEFRLPGMLVLADTANYNEQLGEVSFEKSQFVIHNVNARGKADLLQMTQNEEQQTLILKNSYFSVCPPTKNDWALEASEFDIDYESGWGEAWHARVLIKDVPIFYLPYMNFPIDGRRKTGVLFPSFSGGSDGFEYKQSLYINLAPNYDLTYTPHYIQDHGLLNSLEGRYKNRYSEWNIGTSYIGNDKQLDGVYIDDNPGLTKEDGKRWGLVVLEEGNFGPHWRHSIDYAAVSDVAFLRDWGGSGLEIRKQDTIQREGRFDYFNNDWQVTLRAVDFEQLELDDNGKQKDDQYSLLPEFTVDYRSSATPWQLNPIALARISSFDHKTKETAIRGYSNVGLGFTMSSQAYKLSNEIKAKGVYYDYSSDNIDRNGGTDNFIQNNGAALTSYKLNSQLFFESNSFKADNTGYTQTITPRLQYYYAPYREQLDQPDFDTAELSFNYSQAFREERFSGYDRIGDENKLSLGLETGVFKHSDGSQVFNIGIAQVFYYSDRKVLINATDADKKIVNDPTLSDDQLAFNEAFNNDIDKKYFRSYSDLAMRGQYFINTEQSILLDGVYDTDSSKVQRSGIYWHYQHESGAIVNIGHAFERYLPKLANTDNDTTTPNVLVDQNTTSADMSFYTPLNSISSIFGHNWAFFGRLNWDLEKSETIENLGGLKYESCCWSVFVAMQRERRIYDAGKRLETWDNSKYDNHWFLEFELKGLGGMTNSIIRLLEESIEGFNR